MSTKSTAQNSLNESLSYEGSLYTPTSPSNLQAIAQLFEVHAVDPARASILEIGCAHGHNIISIAMSYPEAKIIGIDASEQAIQHATKQKNGLGLTNIEFVHKAFTSLDKSLGKFDYIIVPSVLSSLPQEEQDKFFATLQSMLTKQGLLYISYDTLPGWNIVSSIRDMMLYHTRAFTEPMQKIQQARLLLNFFNESLGESQEPHAVAAKRETRFLMQQSDSYLWHNYLSSEKHPMYFHQVAELANKHQLMYLAEASLPEMYLRNLSDKASTALQQITDIVRLEQYMDFIKDRRFRATIFCQADVAINRNVDVANISKLTLSRQFILKTPEAEINLDDDTTLLELDYLQGRGILRVSAASMKAVYRVLVSSYSQPLTIDEICKKAASEAKQLTAKEIKAVFTQEVVHLVFTGILNIHPASVGQTKARKSGSGNKSITAPALSPLALYQAKNTNQDWLTNLNHERVNINNFQKLVAQYLTGENSKEQVLAQVIKHFENGEAHYATAEGKQIQDIKDIAVILQPQLERLYSDFQAANLLIA